jgi:hypothetical protein
MENKRCLVLMPIGVTRRHDSPTFAALYQHVLVPALQATGWPLDIFRGDDVMRPGLNLSEGRLWLQEPHVVLADLTTRHSGVVHDLKLRDFLADRTILLSQQAEDIPPRFTTYRCIIYSLSAAGIAQLGQELKHHISAILTASRPLADTARAGHGKDDG